MNYYTTQWKDKQSMINLLKYENIVLDFDGVILDANKERKKI